MESLPISVAGQVHDPGVVVRERSGCASSANIPVVILDDCHTVSMGLQAEQTSEGSACACPAISHGVEFVRVKEPSSSIEAPNGVGVSSESKTCQHAYPPWAISAVTVYELHS
jgi:hypothetical protein